MAVPWRAVVENREPSPTQHLENRLSSSKRSGSSEPPIATSFGHHCRIDTQVDLSGVKLKVPQDIVFHSYTVRDAWSPLKTPHLHQLWTEQQVFELCAGDDPLSDSRGQPRPVEESPAGEQAQCLSRTLLTRAGPVKAWSSS